jgi:hypothetical protein
MCSLRYAATTTVAINARPTNVVCEASGVLAAYTNTVTQTG